MQFATRYKTKYFYLCPFPLTPGAVEEYIMHLRAYNRPASAFHGFRARPCMFVRFEGQDLITQEVHRTLEIEDGKKKEKTQARLLTVAEVEYLDNA